MKPFFREPFVHFVILGGLLFAGHSLWRKHITKADHIIVVSPSEMERQAQIFARENQRAPSDADLEGLLFAHIEEEALMREAIRLGLDEDDTIIRRRLAQKMRFMIDDVAVPDLPSTADLKAWFEANADRFVRPETRSFEHIYLSPRDRAETVVSDASSLLEAGISEDWQSQGDAFMAGRQFTRLAKPAVQRDFGTDFANALFALPNNANWQGPINSAFGVHLVRLTNVTEQYQPEFDQIITEVEAVWLNEAKRVENREALKNLISQYKVEVAE